MPFGVFLPIFLNLTSFPAGLHPFTIWVHAYLASFASWE